MILNQVYDVNVLVKNVYILMVIIAFGLYNWKQS